jgi:hypothetical protein
MAGCNILRNTAAIDYFRNLWSSMQYPLPVRRWPGFISLLLLAFCLKGVVYMSVLPPFEGWDEYQHLAYIIHLQETGERPVLLRDTVSRQFLQDIFALPVPKHMQEQTAATGAVDYHTFFASDAEPPVYNPHHPDIRLYQAQHGSLYYWLMAPVVGLFYDGEAVIDVVSILRFINIVFAAMALAAIFWLINHIFADKGAAAMAAMLVACHPLYLVNAVRVGNDALAIMTGCWVVVIALVPRLRANLFYVACAGLLLGISCWTKSTSFALLPFWVCCLGVAFLQKQLTFGKLLVCLSVSLVLAGAVLWQHFQFNLQHYGTLFFMQETVANKGKQMDLPLLLNMAFSSSVFSDIYYLWTRDSIWTGGWSFLRVHHIKNISLVLLSLSMLSWIGVFSSRKQKGYMAGETSLLCLLLCLLISLAIFWHYLQCLLAWGDGGATSNPWYLCLGLPFFLLFIFDSGRRWSEKFAICLATVLIALYLYADMRGLVTMISHYSGGDSGWSALAKIASMHPLWLGTPVFFSASAGFLVLTALAILFILQRSAEKPS